MSVKEHVCTLHKNDVNGQLALRYEAKTEGCPLCEALKAEKPEGNWVSQEDFDIGKELLAKAADQLEANKATIEKLELEAKDATAHAKVQVEALGEQLETIKKKDDFSKQQDEEITALKKAIAEGNDVKDLEDNQD